MMTAIDMTTETAKASTVHHPLGKPGGPGLFRMKGAQLPAYIQNVAKHMDGPLSRKIQMAIGIVRNWAQGHDGHGNHVSPDVQAAAVKAIAEYDALRAKAKATPNKGSDNAAEHAKKVDLAVVKTAAGVARYKKGIGSQIGGGGGQTWQQKAQTTYKAGLASVHSREITPQMVAQAQKAVKDEALAKKAATVKQRLIIRAAKARAKAAKKKPIHSTTVKKKPVHSATVKKTTHSSTTKHRLAVRVAKAKAAKKPVHLSTAIDLAFGQHAHKQNMTKGELQTHLGDQHGLRVDNGATRGRMAAMHKMCHSPF